MLLTDFIKRKRRGWFGYGLINASFGSLNYEEG